MTQTQSVTLITGASRGIGAAVARRIAQVGGAVTLASRSTSMLDRVAGEIERNGGEALPLTIDVSDPDQCAQAVASTIERFGRLDALVNNAGVFEPLAKVADSSPKAWAYNFQVNVMGPFLMSRAAIRALRRTNGRIVNVSSGAAVHVIQAAAAYCAAKAALNQFTRVMAAEEPDVTIVAVRPGVVDTQMQQLIRQVGPSAMPPEQAAYYLQLKSENRLEPPLVPARTIAWLALYAGRNLSGRFFSYDDPLLIEPARQIFGD